jgi:hypothetical protein
VSTYAIDGAIRAKILACTGVSALLGNRIYAEQGPQNPTFPYLVYSLNDSRRHTTLNNGPKRSATAQYSVTLWATTRAGANSLASLITASAAEGGLDGFRGSLDGTVFAQMVSVANRTHGSFTSQSADESYLYSASFDLTVFHNLV